MAEIRRSGTWSSALTSDEFAAVRTAGFEPAGQVLGAAVYNIGYTGGYGRPGGGGGYNLGWGPARDSPCIRRGRLGLVRPAGQDDVRGPPHGDQPDGGRVRRARRARRG